MNLLIGAVTVGLILALLGLGVFITYRIYHTLDLTGDGSFGVGAAVAAALLVQGASPIPATVAATLAGVVAGGISGTLHTRLGVSAILAGVLTSTGLYSVSLFVMGSGNLSLASAPSLVNLAERAGHGLLGLPPSLTLFGDTVSGAAVATLVLALLLAGGLALALGLFLGTDLGSACGRREQPQMARAVAIDVDAMVVWARPLNGYRALRSAVRAIQGFATSDGIGAVMTGLAT
jgi:putative ABC transport system permease protein